MSRADFAFFVVDLVGVRVAGRKSLLVLRLSAPLAARAARRRDVPRRDQPNSPGEEDRDAESGLLGPHFLHYVSDETDLPAGIRLPRDPAASHFDERLRAGM